ncbi:MAG: hypothetical protein ACOC53_06475 [Candidatus Saliniplasma sp.]
MIQIICDENGNPLETGYSQHYDGETKSWSNTLKENGYPKVYIAKGGHASFHTEKKYSLTDPRGDFGEDHTFRNGEYDINMIGSENWLNFKGHWGEHGWPGPSPEGPVFRHSHGPDAYFWIEPMYWQSEW